MNYLIAVLPDRTQAEAAYSALQEEGLPMERVSILGKGYKTADEYSFIDPSRQSRKQATFMSYWLVPFGFAGGFVFNELTSFELFPWAGSLGNHIIGGIFGAIAGAMGSFFVGGNTSFSFSGSESLPYRNRLKQGKYVIVVSGPPNLTNQANRVLKQFEPENMQGYVDPTKA